MTIFNKRSFSVKNFFHICLGLLPFLAHFIFPILNISVGTVLMLIFIPYSLLFLSKPTQAKEIIPFLIFYFYMILRADGDSSRIILCFSSVFIIWGILNGSINSVCLRNVLESFAIFNSIIIILQIISYYVFGFRLQPIPRALIHPLYENSYVFRNDPGLYRPSALFLEPSHFSEYCCFALISVLFPDNGKKVNFRRAFFIAVCCILTTSGMGIALVVCIFGWYLFVSAQTKRKRIMIVLKTIPFIVAGVVILLQFPFFTFALQRVFSTTDSGYNAIQGRTGNWSSAISPMKGIILLFGYGNSAEYPYYLNGLADTIYKYGIIGLFFEVFCFLYLMATNRGDYVWCVCISFLGLFCLAHLTSFYSQLFYFGLIISKNFTRKRYTIGAENG